MKSAIYSAYVAGLCPLNLMMEIGKYGLGSHPMRQAGPMCETSAADLTGALPQRQHSHASDTHAREMDE